MMRFDIGRLIREKVSMQDILDYYGYRTKHGYMVCPFHSEKKPSLKIYGNSWYCFGCRRGGSVIDFVKAQEECSFAVAVRAIDRAFHLGLMEGSSPLDEYRKQETNRLDALADNLMGQIQLKEYELESKIIRNIHTIQRLEEIAVPDRSAAEWDELLQSEEEINHLEYEMQRCDELRTETMEWRRKSHGALYERRQGK